MIAIAVFTASIGGPVIGGILSVFPAILLSTTIILYLRQGEAFTGATGRSMVPGTVNIVAYVLIAYLFFPEFGTYLGTVLTVIPSYIWSALFYSIMTRV